jgi:hypothetical protein
MEIAIIIGCVVVVVVWLLRKLRAREVAAFMKQESAVEAKLLSASPKVQQGSRDDSEQAKVGREREQDALLLRRAEAFLQRPDNSMPDTPVPEQKSIGYALRPRVLPEYLITVAQRLENSVSADVKILFNQPLTGFMLPRPDLQAKNLSLLICDAVTYELMAGVEFRQDVSNLELQLLDKAFRQVDMPFFVLSNPVKMSEVNECVTRLNSLQTQVAKNSQRTSKRAARRSLASSASADTKHSGNRCPKCRGVMQQKRASIDNKKLSKVWVCTDYPLCKGMLVDDSV